MDTPSPFSPEKLREQVERVLNQIPPQSRRVCLAYAKADGTVTLAYLRRTSPHWTMGLIAGHAPKEGWTGEVALRGVW